MAEDDLWRRGIIVGRERSQDRPAQRRVVGEMLQIRHQSRDVPFDQCRQGSLPHIERNLPVANDPAQYRRGLGIFEVECQQKGLLHDGQVGSGQQPGKRIGHPLGRDVLAPAQASLVPIKRSRQALSFAGLEQ